MDFIHRWWWVLGVWYLNVWRIWGWSVGVILVMRRFERRLLPLLLLAKDLDGVLELHESCPFSIDVLPSGFGTLSCCMRPYDNFLFLMEHFDLLLNPG
jgi:hypothetical protein